ncbi:MAG: von Willebrand factor type A domain-containing protein [Caldilineaceae bacterium]|nr:von Willebrand factor type A domain-containing protein [Caldilineaceae bacterium]
MQRSSALPKLAGIAMAASLILNGCSMGMTSPAAPASSGSSYANQAAMEAPAAASYPKPPAGMAFEDYGMRGFVTTTKDNLSTFAVDVDTGSYTVARSYVQDGWLPPEDAVRAEEFVNYFNYRYPNPAAGETFAITIDGAPFPFAERQTNRMVRIGVQGYSVPAEERQDVALTFVIDVSGSMDMENRLGLAKRALYLLVDQLRPTDSVAIVVYGTNARTVLDMTRVSEKPTILNAINRLVAEGSTNAGAGLWLAYRLASENFNPEAINRVVLLSDGVANVGETGPDQILAAIKEHAAEGITLTTVGMGMGNYNDTLMEQLADNGDGFYAYVDSMQEAERIFVDKLTSSLLTIAKDAKLQVEFNPETVERYRLVGYENRDVADDDFRNDEVDAGEIGAGHSVTALYELEMAPGNETPEALIATVHLRWEEIGTGEVIEMEQPFMLGDMAAAFEESDPRFQLAVAVAEYAELLKHSPFAWEGSLADLSREVQRIDDLLAELDGEHDADVRELAQLVWLADSLQASNP